jgi:hypothetical protein
MFVFKLLNSNRRQEERIGKDKRKRKLEKRRGKRKKDKK